MTNKEKIIVKNVLEKYKKMLGVNWEKLNEIDLDYMFSKQSIKNYENIDEILDNIATLINNVKDEINFSWDGKTKQEFFAKLEFSHDNKNLIFIGQANWIYYELTCKNSP